MLRVLVYLGRTADMEIVYSGTGEGATKLIGRADSDWSIKRSTTGYYIALAGGTVSHRSHRQHCIAMSSTEAEMMALADLALEMLYVMAVLAFIGFDFEEQPEVATSKYDTYTAYHKTMGDIKHGPVEVATDNTGAYDLCNSSTTG